MGSPPAAIIANRTNYKTSILIGLGLYAGGALLFWPAGVARAYPLFLGAVRARPGRLGTLSVSHSKSVLCGAFV